MAENKVIYCPPDNIDRGILRIDTKTDVVTELDVDLHPKRGDENNAFHAMWKSCALALDGCIYFMPYDARHIMKLDPNNNDAMISIGDDVYYRGAFVGTFVGIDGISMGYLVDRVNTIRSMTSHHMFESHTIHLSHAVEMVLGDLFMQPLLICEH